MISVFAAHGLARTRTRRIWHSSEEPPAYYSNILLLDPGGKDELLIGVADLKRTSPRGFTFKDGYSVIDGEAEGLKLLFSAAWIMRLPQHDDATVAPWKQVCSEEELATWEKAWSLSSPTTRRNFPEGILEDSSVTFFFDDGPSGPKGGCIVNQSKECVGLSNIFGGSYDDALTCALSIARGKPVVGYERGADLDAAMTAGFRNVAPLNIWNVS